MTAREDMGAALARLARCYQRGTHQPVDLADAFYEEHVGTTLEFFKHRAVLERSEFVLVTRRLPDKPSASGWGGDLVTEAVRRPLTTEGERRLWRLNL